MDQEEAIWNVKATKYKIVSFLQPLFRAHMTFFAFFEFVVVAYITATAAISPSSSLHSLMTFRGKKNNKNLFSSITCQVSILF